MSIRIMNDTNQTPVRDAQNILATVPFGEALTPVLPLWYWERYASLPLARIVRKANLRYQESQEGFVRC